MSRATLGRHIYRKCFRTLLNRKCGSFQKAEVERTTLISCLDYAEGAILASLSPYLFRCGVLHRLFRLGLSTTFC